MGTLKHERGIRRTSHGWQVYTTKGGKFRSKHLPAETEISTLRKERGTLEARATLGLDAPAAEPVTGPTLADDVESYLKAIAGMTTYSDRAYRVKKWRDALGPERSRSTVTAVEIRQQLEAWRVKGAAPGTLNLLNTALRHLWTVLDGPDARNPLRAIPRYREEEKPLSLPPWKAAVDLLENLEPSKSRARLKVLLWTGWPSAIVKRLRPQDINWRKREAVTHGRRKGGGTKPRVVPLHANAVKALREFAAADAWGPFSGSALHSLLHRACDAASMRRFRVYDLRHLFVTRLTLKSKDERGVAELALHSTPSQTWRYSRQAGSTRAKSALARLARF